MSNGRAPLRLERAGDVALITLDRVEAANALSKALVAELRRALGELAADANARAVVIMGAGDKAFCAGADLKERRAMSLEETRAFLDELNAVMNELAAFPRPSIAALNGAALGGGLELALCCDVRVAAEHATMGLSEVKLGIIPGAGGTQRLSRICGVGAAKELILTGRRIHARRALEIGLVSAVVTANELGAEVARWTAEIAEAGPLAVREAKRAIDDGFGRPLGEALAIERAGYESVLESEDRNEGLAAFAEKRKPRYRGR